jgi:RNA polymerase sigma factor (sigma-70 family)
MPGTTRRRRERDLAADESPIALPAVEMTMWDASDEALIAGYASGDADVARVLVGRFQARVYGLALTVTGDRMAAEEVAQDTFLRAWRYAASYDPRRGSVAAWLLRIARNAALDHVRRRERRLDRPAIDQDEVIGQQVGDADIASPVGDLAPVVDRLRTLPDEQRATLMAAAYYGMTAKEISEAWDVPLGTVKTRLRLALAKVRGLSTEVTP